MIHLNRIHLLCLVSLFLISIALGQEEATLDPGSATLVQENIDRQVSVLIEGLKDHDPSVRSGSARSLWKFGPRGKKAVPALIEASPLKNRKIASLTPIMSLKNDCK